MDKVILIHYGELGLKGKNRHEFEKQLLKNIAEKLGTSSSHLILQNKRIILPLPCQGIKETELLNKLTTIPGIAWFSLAWKVTSQLSAIEKLTKKLALVRFGKKSFAVRVKRADKTFPLSSIELEKKLGQMIVEQTHAKVNLHSPDITLFVEITAEAAYVHLEKISGVGGLPIGTAGKVLALLSGGIDSPVAAWLMAKRGAQVDLVHFSALAPEKVKDSKIGQLQQGLRRYLGKTKLYILPYVHFQLAVSQLSNQFRRYEVLLFRRFMFQTAAVLAGQLKAMALVAGDNLSQVASQTLANLVVTDKNQTISIFRPLIGFDKQEIIAAAQKLGTYEISIQPYKDCCSLLHKQPIIVGKWEIIKAAEEQLNMEELIQVSLKEILILE